MGTALAETGRRRTGPKLPPDWREAVLVELRRHGGMYRAARAAGVEPSTVWRHAQVDAEFAAAMKDAREELADDLAAEMVDQARKTGNPVGYIVRLKSIRPTEYSEKHMHVSVALSAEVSSDDVMSVLQLVLGQGSTDTTMRAITEGRTDGTHDTRPAREADGREMVGESEALSLPPANAREGQVEIPRALPPA